MGHSSYSRLRLISQPGLAACFGCLLLSMHVLGCAGYQRYAPAPVDVRQHAALPDALSQAGVAADEALIAVETATRGASVAQVFEGNRATDVVVTMEPEQLTRPEDIGRIPLASETGRIVPLAQVAEIARVSGRYSVAHEGARRLQTVTTNVA